MVLFRYLLLSVFMLILWFFPAIGGSVDIHADRYGL